MIVALAGGRERTISIDAVGLNDIARNLDQIPMHLEEDCVFLYLKTFRFISCHQSPVDNCCQFVDLGTFALR